jgi:hypothetical protein
LESRVPREAAVATLEVAFVLIDILVSYIVGFKVLGKLECFCTAIILALKDSIGKLEDRVSQDKICTWVLI